MPSAADTFIAQLQSQPWYGAVRAQFVAAGVADPLWEATLLHEDAGLDPTIITHEKDGSTSVGLFQLNNRGIGSGLSLADEQDPVKNAHYAAAAMGQGFYHDLTFLSTDLRARMRSIENSGWPGNLSQDAARQADLSAIAGSTGAIAGGVGGVWNGAAPAIGNALGFPSTDQISTWLTQALIAGVLLALLAGGFALLAAPAVEKAAPLAAAAA